MRLRALWMVVLVAVLTAGTLTYVRRGATPVPAPSSPPIELGVNAAVAMKPEARVVLAGIRATHDNGGLPVLMIDKTAARLYVFDGQGRFVADTPILLGAARGDDTVPGIGDRPLVQIRADEKTTPAGRFRAERGVNTGGEDIIWVDYDAAVSIHRVRANNAAERRLERLATPTADDNRISFGCINVPKRFYEGVVDPLVTKGGAVVYILPEVKSITAVFGAPLVASSHDSRPSFAAQKRLLRVH